MLETSCSAGIEIFCYDESTDLKSITGWLSKAKVSQEQENPERKACHLEGRHK